jgi:hypothetical protein
MWLSVSGNYSEEDYDEYYDYYYDIYYEHRSIESTEIDASAFILIPHFGIKFLMGSRDVKPFLFGNVFFSIPSVTAESKTRDEEWTYVNDQLVDHEINRDTDELDDETKDLVNDILGFWGITLGGGAEYFFSENFSIGGEFGVRLIFNTVEYSDKTHEEYGPNDSYTEEIDSEISASFKVSYAVFTLNYYF